MSTPRGIIKKPPNIIRPVITRQPRIMRIPPVGIMNMPRIMRAKRLKLIRKNTATNRVAEPRWCPRLDCFSRARLLSHLCSTAGHSRERGESRLDSCPELQLEAPSLGYQRVHERGRGPHRAPKSG